MSRVYLCCSNSIKITVVMLQCVWSLTDEWINFLLVYETDLYPYVLILSSLFTVKPLLNCWALFWIQRWITWICLYIYWYIWFVLFLFGYSIGVPVLARLATCKSTKSKDLYPRWWYCCFQVLFQKRAGVYSQVYKFHAKPIVFRPNNTRLRVHWTASKSHCYTNI